MSCPICLDTFKNIKKLSCNHDFCKDCIDKWTKNTCPLCRKVIINQRKEQENLIPELYCIYKNCRIYQGNLYGFRPTLDNYLEDSRIKICVNSQHKIFINKPYGVTIFCKDCNKTILFNWLN